jgi:6-phosphogluconate dehydrogenase
MSQPSYRIGMVGLGVMGRSLLLNMADHGFAVAGYDKNLARGEALARAGAGKAVAAAPDLPALVAMLQRPRVILLLVPPAAVDVVLGDLLLRVEQGDLIIDAGNSHFQDTDRRGQLCAAEGVHFFGMGLSGGEAGARRGPCLMPGGPRESFEQVRPVLEAVAARVHGEPCVHWMGNGSAGHYVKMVHNGIEYGLMQMIAEVYDLLHRGAGLNNDELHAVFDAWNKGGLNSFLIECSARIFQKRDDRGGAARLVDMVKDTARLKGTGRWSAQDALELQVPVPTIDMALTVRDLSGMAAERAAVAAALGAPSPGFALDRKAFIDQVGQALQLGSILAYAQGMDLLRHASKAYGYGLNLAEVAKIWRGGCIIHSALLEDIRVAYGTQPDLPSLLVDSRIAARVKSLQPGLRAVARAAIDLGLPAPCLMASLGYLDCLKAGSLPTNLTQAQRDFFGAHTYERIDAEGTFHSHWDQP